MDKPQFTLVLTQYLTLKWVTHPDWPQAVNLTTQLSTLINKLCNAYVFI